MKEKELLQQQIDKLEKKDFDLEVWKNQTMILLARIFGDDNQMVKQIEKLEYEHSSWALRDTSGYDSYLQSCKKIGREILMAAIDEIENSGIKKPRKKTAKTLDINIILSALEDEMKGSQYKSLKNLLMSDINDEEKKRQLKETVETLGIETTQMILEKILLSEDFIAGLKD